VTVPLELVNCFRGMAGDMYEYMQSKSQIKNFSVSEHFILR
jgi:hypothetical protein